MSALDAGSKGTPQGRQWYGGVKRAGRNDPLTSYMLQARNAEEHALQPTARNEQPSIAIGAPGEDITIGRLTIDRDFFRNPEKHIVGRAWRTSDGKPPTIVRNAGGPSLLPVCDDRFGTTFRPPTEHLGRPLAKADPISVAELYLCYLEGLLTKATELS